MNSVESEVFAEVCDLTRENIRLREQVRVLRETVHEAVDEISWFVKREINLKLQTDSGRKWSEVLDDDLTLLRAALEATK